MTAPIQFPTISPPQLAPSDSGLHDLPQLLLAITHGRQQLALQKQNLALERQRTEASVAASGESTAASKQEREDKKREMELKEQRLEAATIVANALPGIVTAPGDRGKEAEATRVRLIQTNKKLAPFINEAFNAQMEGLEKSRTAIAARRTAEAQAGVEEATAPAQVTTAKAGAARAVTEASRSKVNLVLDEFRRLNDPARAAVFLDAVAKHVPVGAAREIAGIKDPFKHLSDDFMLPDPTVNEATRKAESSAVGMALGNALVKSAYAAHPDLRVSTLGAVMRTSGLTQILASPFVSDGQKQLVQGFQMMGAHYALHITGTQSANAETVRLMNTIADQPGDSPAMLTRRAFVREVVVEQGNLAAQGRSTPVEAMQQVMNSAIKFRLPPADLAVFREQLNDARRFMGTDAFKAQRAALKASAGKAAGGFVDPILNESFRIAPKPLGPP